MLVAVKHASEDMEAAGQSPNSLPGGSDARLVAIAIVAGVGEIHGGRDSTSHIDSAVHCWQDLKLAFCN